MKKQTKKIIMIGGAAVLALVAGVIGYRIIAKLAQGANQRRPAAITVGLLTLAKQSVDKTLTFQGIVEGDPQVKVFSPAAGKFLSNAVAEGAFVAADQVLADIDRGLVGQDFQPVLVRSPVAGMVKKLYFVDRGAPVTLDKPVAEIANPARVKIVLTVGEADLSRVKPGLAAVIRSPYDPQLALPGSVFSVTPFVDSDTFSGSIIVKADNSKGTVKIGMSASVDIVTERSEIYLVPVQAVQEDLDSAFVFLIRDGIARRVAVRTGYGKGGFVEIEGEVKDGDVVATDGSFKLFDGALIASAQKPSASAEPPADRPPAGGSRGGVRRAGAQSGEPRPSGSPAPSGSRPSVGQ
jgi:multidrug efflux pump subunit AcrA (membrane-fusion protein)